MPQELSESDTFVLLAKRRRRLALRVLQESISPLGATELAERIAVREFEDPSSEETTTVYLSLYHNHLPRLAGADAVTYDSDEGTVYPGLNFDALVRMLERVNERDLPWSDE